MRRSNVVHVHIDNDREKHTRCGLPLPHHALQSYYGWDGLAAFIASYPGGYRAPNVACEACNATISDLERLAALEL